MEGQVGKMIKKVAFVLLIIIVTFAIYLGIYHLSLYVFTIDIQSSFQAQGSIPSFLSWLLYLSIFVLPVLFVGIVFLIIDRKGEHSIKLLVGGYVVLVIVLEIIATVVFMKEQDQMKQLTYEYESEYEYIDNPIPENMAVANILESKGII